MDYIDMRLAAIREKENLPLDTQRITHLVWLKMENFTHSRKHSTLLMMFTQKELFGVMMSYLKSRRVMW